VAVALLEGRAPKAELTLYGAPSQLFTPAVVTTANLKAEIIDKMVSGKPIQTPAELCGDRYAVGCKKLGLIP
jgi:D-xylose transport system substrate-binding protein